MSFEYSIRFSGAGGQGLVQIARIVAEAAAIFENKNATESISYGPEARGNTCRADIIISDGVIAYPKVKVVDFLLVLTQEACDKYISELSPDGIIVADSEINIGADSVDRKLITAPFKATSEEIFGAPVMTEIVALGFFAYMNKVIGEDAIQNAILARIPKNSEETYLKALNAGLKLAADKNTSSE
ncbi:MAG: 2-oxoacid:ferredoxin oxidoreductase subunit gamma [candidate division Zixibacteria bacterium]|nr:2-oxoacid:ferredoxin oxidoreductase subunit gamma [candidate division Zixibacteria bacterium]